MKRFLFVIAIGAMLITGCGKSGGGVPVSTNVSVEGNVQNNGVLASVNRGLYRTVDFMFGTAFAVPVDSVNSKLKNLDTPIVIPAISAGQQAEISATVRNEGPGILSGATVVTQIEHHAYITPEEFACVKTYPNNNGGETANQLWSVQGRNMFEMNDPAPAVPDCIKPDVGTCQIDFADEVDCELAVYTETYVEPGDGVDRQEFTVPDLASGQTSTAAYSVSMNTAENIRAGHYARYQVIRKGAIPAGVVSGIVNYNAADILAQKDYVFDVIN